MCLGFVVRQILIMQPSAVTIRMKIGTVFRVNSCPETINMASLQNSQAQHKEQSFNEKLL